MAVKTCFQLQNWHDGIFGIFSLLHSIRVSISHGIELVFNVSFRISNRFRIRIRIRINNVMSVSQLATTVAAILVLTIRHSSGFIFVAKWAIQLYIDQWMTLPYREHPLITAGGGIFSLWVPSNIKLSNNLLTNVSLVLFVYDFDFHQNGRQNLCSLDLTKLIARKSRITTPRLNTMGSDLSVGFSQNLKRAI